MVIPIPLPRQPDRPRMTPREQDYLDALRTWIAYAGRPPTVREFAHYVGRTPPPVHGALTRLEHKGYVRRNHERRFEVRP